MHESESQESSIAYAAQRYRSTAHLQPFESHLLARGRVVPRLPPSCLVCSNILDIERCVNHVVHAIRGVTEAGASNSGDDSSREESEPNDLVRIFLSSLEGSRRRSEDRSCGTRNTIQSLTGHEEADERAEVARIEAKGDDSSDDGGGDLLSGLAAVDGCRRVSALCSRVDW